MSRLEIISEQFRKQNLVKNKFSSNDEFGSSHPNAISDGDNFGKEPATPGAEAGSATDISSRKKMLVKNKFSSNNPYSDATA